MVEKFDLELGTNDRGNTMAETTELMTVDNICNRVYIIRGQQVMLDYDLAEIYGYEVKRLNEQVKRNVARFPEDFMFQLTKDEIPKSFLKSQIATLNENGNKRGLHIKKFPYAFTEQGIYMLAQQFKLQLLRNLEIWDGVEKKLLTNELTRIILSLIILKGSTDMYLFAIENSYNSKWAVQNNGHGLIDVCEYFSYEEK